MPTALDEYLDRRRAEAAGVGSEGTALDRYLATKRSGGPVTPLSPADRQASEDVTAHATARQSSRR